MNPAIYLLLLMSKITQNILPPSSSIRITDNNQVRITDSGNTRITD